MTITKQLKTMTENELKLEALRLKMALNEKGVKHIFDFMVAFYPEKKIDKANYNLFISGRRANWEYVEILQNIVELIKQ